MSTFLCPIAEEFKSIRSVSDLLSWHYPKATGIVLGGVTSSILFYHFMEYTVVTFACRIFQILFVLGGGLGFISTCKLQPDDIHRAVDRFAEHATPCAISAIQKLHEIITWRNYMLSLKVFFGTLIVGFLGNLMSDLFLCIVVLIVAFTMPVVYEQKKTEIDAALKKVRAFIDQNLGPIMTNVEKVMKKNE